MFRWIILAVLALLMLGCAKKIVHCDGCGKEIKVPANSDTNEDWIILCDDCQAKLYKRMRIRNGLSPCETDGTAATPFLFVRGTFLRSGSVRGRKGNPKKQKDAADGFLCGS